MSYKPKYCCQCGDKIERANWNFMTSRRFCDVCETDFRHLDWLPKAALVVSIILTIITAGFFFKRPEKSLVVSTNNSPSASGFSNQNASAQFVAAQNTGAQANVQQTSANPANAPKPAAAAAKSSEKIKSLENQTSAAAAAEAVYFCGAQTKKGTPCTRRVKGGGRCWQHAGQPAMLPAEKLAAN